MKKSTEQGEWVGVDGWIDERWLAKEKKEKERAKVWGRWVTASLIRRAKWASDLKWQHSNDCRGAALLGGAGVRQPAPHAVS